MSGLDFVKKSIYKRLLGPEGIGETEEAASSESEVRVELGLLEEPKPQARNLIETSLPQRALPENPDDDLGEEILIHGPNADTAERRKEEDLEVEKFRQERSKRRVRSDESLLEESLPKVDWKPSDISVEGSLVYYENASSSSDDDSPPPRKVPKQETKGLETARDEASTEQGSKEQSKPKLKASTLDSADG